MALRRVQNVFEGGDGGQEVRRARDAFTARETHISFFNVSWKEFCGFGIKIYFWTMHFPALGGILFRQRFLFSEKTFARRGNLSMMWARERKSRTQREGRQASDVEKITGHPGVGSGFENEC